MGNAGDPVRATILALEDERYAAVLRQDYDAFEDLCHPALVYGHTAGNRDSLDTYLTKLRSGALRYFSIEHPVEKVVLMGETALVLGEMNADLRVNGTTKTLNNTCMAVWTKHHGSWKFIAYQPTPRS